MIFAAGAGLAAATPGNGGGDDFDDTIDDTIDSDDPPPDVSAVDDSSVDDNSADDSSADDTPDAPDDSDVSESGSSGGSGDDDQSDDSDHGTSGGSGHDDDSPDDHSGTSGGSGHDDESGGSNDGGDSGSSGGSGHDDGNSDDNSGSGGSGSNSGSSGGDGGDDGGNSGSGSNSGSSHGGESGSNSGSESSNSGSSNSGSSNSGSSNSGSSHSTELAAAPAERILAVERDQSGHEHVSGEVLMSGLAADVHAARDAGFTLINEKSLDSTGGELARLRIPENMSIEQAVSTLRTLAPEALVTPNTVYRSSQSFISASPPAPGRRPMARFVGTLGIVDTGVNTSALPQADALLSHTSFASPRPIAREHGSVVAALAIEHGMRVHVADVFGRSGDGALAASADSIAAALDWMIANNVPVVNVSIEGPNNAVLADIVARAARRGHVIVAAAGNGGPMAAPAYPAAFEGSVAVTAIDQTGRPYLRANRGEYIAFAAPGVNVDVQTGDHTVSVSGTSFAAPLVAANIAAQLHEPSPAQAQRVLASLRSEAVDLGAPGHDPIFGWGALRN